MGDPREAAAYLTAAAEDEDPRVFLIALGDVIAARGGVSAIARKAGLNRGNLHRMLSGGGFPRLDNLARLLAATGLRINLVPLPVSPAKKRVVAAGRRAIPRLLVSTRGKPEGP
jgi:probable addiction module antidote protein